MTSVEAAKKAEEAIDLPRPFETSNYIEFYC